MDLHRTGKRAQWLTVPSGKRNRWQRLAKRTHGIVTPGNVISLFGAIVVAAGLVYLYRGMLGVGLVCLLIGRLADVVDGIIAAKTGTKGPLGEAVDATIDKLTLLAAIIVFMATNVVPWLAVLLIALLNAANAAFSVIAKLRKHAIHPSLVGKLAAVFQWAAILLYVAAAAMYSADMSFAGTTTTVFASSGLIVSVVLGLIAVAGYAIAALRPREDVLEI